MRQRVLRVAMGCGLAAGLMAGWGAGWAQQSGGEAILAPATKAETAASAQAGAAASPSPAPGGAAEGQAPVRSADVGAQVKDAPKTPQDLPPPAQEALEQQESPREQGLPDVLTGEPEIPPDLLAPLPKPPVMNDGGTVKASSEVLQRLRAMARAGNPPPADKKLTLDDAVQQALRHNPDVLQAVEQIRVASGQVIAVRAQLLPQVSFAPAYNFLEPDLAGPPRGGVPPQNHYWNMQFVANQLLFDSGAALSQLSAARSGEVAAYFQLRKVIDEVISQVKVNFFQIILNRALIVAQEQSVALLESQLQDQINRFEAGTVPRFNVLQAEVALANAIPPLIAARNALRISQYQLVRLLGMNTDKAKLDQVPFDVQGTLDFRFREINAEESIRTALIRNPLLKALRQDILAQAANVNAALAGYGPKISAQAGYQWQNDRTTRDLSQEVQGWFFGVQGSWALFDGFLTTGQVKQAKARLEQSKVAYDNAVRSVILQVQEAISNLQQARETIDSQQASVAQAEEALRLARERLDAGAGTQLDVLNQQVSLLQAQTTLLQARFGYIQALAQYDAALSLDTQWEEVFDDPLSAPERRRFIKVNAPERPQPALPRAYRKEDPLDGVLPVKPERKKSAPQSAAGGKRQ